MKNFLLKFTKQILLCIFLFVFTQNTYSATWYVNDNATAGDIYCTAVGNNANSGLTPALPKLTLAEAITAASAGDTIYVDTGNYNATSMTFNKQLIIIGAGTSKTIYDGGHSAAKFATISVNNVSLTGFQIRNYEKGATEATVILINANITGINISYCLFKDNWGVSTSPAHSIVLKSGAVLTLSNSFLVCSGFNGSNGGAIQVESATLTVSKCIFKQNENTVGNGGAINITGGTVNVNDTSFADCTAANGGAIHMSAGTLTVAGSGFFRNTSRTTNSLEGGGAIRITGGTANINNSTFDGNLTTTNGIFPNGSNDGGAICVAGGTVNLTVNTCSFSTTTSNNSSDDGSDIFLDQGTVTAIITNCTFGNDGNNAGTTRRLNIVNNDLPAGNLTIGNCGTSQLTVNQDGINGNNYSFAGTVPTRAGTNTNAPTSVAVTGYINPTTIAACSVAGVNCLTETNPPAILSCVPNKTLTCPAVLPNYTAEVAAYDDCSFTVTQSPAAGTWLFAGNTTVTMTVTDQNNNTSTCTFTVTVATAAAPSNFGNFASAVQITNNGTGTFYNTTGAGADLIGPSTFIGAALGTHTANSGTLKLTGAEFKSWKTGTGNACGGSLYYLVYPTGSRPAIPTFSTFTIPFKANCGGGTFDDGFGPCNTGDQKWSTVAQNIDLTTYANGNYTLEVYYLETGSDSGGGCGTNVYINNACANYTATFVIGAACVAPSISAHPLGATYCQNDSATALSVTAAGTSLTYQWYSNTVNSNSGGTNLGASAQSATYTPSTSSAGTLYYYCEVTGACGNTTSNVATIIVDATTVPGTVSSNQNVCLGTQPADLTLSGNTGSVVKWQKSTDFAFTTPIDIASTSITLTGALIGTLSSTTYFRAVVQNGSCSVQNSNVVTITVPYSIYDGTAWSNGVPTIATTVTFTGNYTATTDMFACSLHVTNNANVVINSGFDYTVYGKVTVDSGSTLTFNNNSNLIQQTDIANVGSIKMKRSTNPLMRLDYTLWGAPVTGQNLLSFSPLTLTNRFYTYNTSTNLYNAVTPSSISFMPGDGYQIRTPNNHPTSPTIWMGTFEGIPNNGLYTKTIANISSTQRFNMIGNPYPSPIDMYAFVAANNSNITGTLWFWRKTNSTITQSIWSTWNSGTFVAANEPYVSDPNDLIRNGQGFFIKASDTGTSVIFNNSMRVSDNSNQFFRNSNVNNNVNTIEKHRIWLNVFNSNNSFFQQAVTYIQGGTNGLDQFDGENNSSTSMMFTSSIPSNSDTFVIQSRPLPFDVNDRIPLNFITNAAGTYSIAIDHKDGIFNDNSQNIFILDKYLQTFNNINNGTYSFSSDVGNFTDRFELRFVESSLSSNEYDFNNSIIVYNQNDVIVINSGKEALKDVKIFDIRGRLITEKKNINSNETSVKIFVQKEVLLLQITTESGRIINKKIII